MVSLLCCGPKMAACGLVLSAWGVVMLVRGPEGPGRFRNLGGNSEISGDNLSIFGRTLKPEPPQKTPKTPKFLFFPPKKPREFPSLSGPERIYRLYEQVSYNCFIAAGLYALLGGFSLCQTRLNKRKEYMVR
ncbi:ribonuclease kappa [Onychostruthus taczanowskii]|uniref:ribonuclease kappa n=1 Tax=Onychostruthus taczanowskii TaxID=356909 RepID=UPI001B802718|nr:ribonuclease kappa [Onychostruthus taczanowskii]